VGRRVGCVCGNFVDPSKHSLLKVPSMLVDSLAVANKSPQ